MEWERMHRWARQVYSHILEMCARAASMSKRVRVFVYETEKEDGGSWVGSRPMSVQCGRGTRPLPLTRPTLTSTVLQFSIQIASTGPSMTIHVCWFLFALAARRHSTENTPSVQSPACRVCVCVRVGG